ncbi:hypothetical protein GCM10028807_28250 [Spirosoma daeguense]
MNSLGRFFGTLVVLLVSSVGSLMAQNPILVPAPTPASIDSTRLIRSISDTLPAMIRRNGILVPTEPAGIRTAVIPGDSSSLDKPDTVRVAKKVSKHRIIPKQATIRSLMLPGLGQAYNRQYYKIPFIYAGYAVMGYLFVQYSGLANEAARGYKQLLFAPVIQPAQPASLEKYPTGIETLISSTTFTIPAVLGQKPEYVEISGYKVYSVATAKNAYDTYRRYRDLNVILSVVLYALNAVEANVAAHLKTFDLSDDISMRIEPNVLPIPGTGPVPGVRIALSFK